MNTRYLKQCFLSLFNSSQRFFTTQGLPYKAAFAIVMYFAGIHLYIISIICLTFLDVLTGVWAAKKRGEKITTKIFGIGIFNKVILYHILLISAFILEKVVQSVTHTQVFYIAWILTILINVYEMTSIIENISAIYPELSFLDKFRTFLNNVSDKEIANATDKLTILPTEKKS